MRIVSAGLILVLSASGAAQADSTETVTRVGAVKTCTTAVANLGGPATGSKPCQVLSVIIADEIAPSPPPAVSSDDVQPVPDRAGSDQGNPGSVDPVAGARTVGLAGTTLSLVSTEVGSRMMTAVTLNPGGLAAQAQDDVSTFATASRFADLTLLLPINLDQPEEITTSQIDYVGVRARINVSSLWKGRELVDGIEKAYDDVFIAMGADQKAVEDVLLAAEGKQAVGACVAALLQAPAEVAEVCGRALATAELTAAREKARKDAVEKYRRAADKYYLGLNLAADIGGTSAATTGTVADGHAVAVSLAFGGNVTDSIGLRARVGMHYFKPKPAGELAQFSVEGGLAVTMRWRVREEEVGLSLGMEGRYGVNDGDELEKSFLDLRLGVSVPLANGTSLGIGLAYPALGAEERTPRLSVAGDWGLLLGRG